MNRNLGVSFLVLCFGLSSVNAAGATEIITVTPIYVQPYDVNELRELNEQMLEQDRLNRDEELAIRGLIDENQNIAERALALQQDVTLQRITRALNSYRDFLVSRDEERIIINGQRVSKYHDLIQLTEDVDNMKSAGRELELKKAAVDEKSVMLDQLKQQLVTLNTELKNNMAHQNMGQAMGKIEEEQEAKINMLTQRLDMMDQKINKYDAVLAEKNKLIALLDDRLNKVQSEVEAKDEMIKQDQDQIADLRNKLQQNDVDLKTKNEYVQQIAQLNDQLVKLQNVTSAKDETIKENQGQMAVLNDNLAKLQSETSAKDDMIKQNQDQIMDLRNKVQQQDADLKTKDESLGQITVLNDNLTKLQSEASAKDDTIKQDQDQILDLSNKLQQKDIDLKTKDESLRQISVLNDNLTKLQSEASAKDDMIKQDQDQIMDLRNKLQQQDAEFQTRGGMIQEDQTRIQTLRDKMEQQDASLKAKDETIHWLNQVADVAKKKANYYQLTAQMNKIPMQELQAEVKNIKIEFAQHMTEYDQLGQFVDSLKDKISQMVLQLSQKQEQVDMLKSELENKITQIQNQGQENEDQQQELRHQLLDRENEIVQIKADILSTLQQEVSKETTLRGSLDQLGEKVGLAKEFMDLQNEETLLLQEKDGLMKELNHRSDQHLQFVENKMDNVIANHDIQISDFKNQMQELQDELDQKQKDEDLLKSELENKIVQLKYQGTLLAEIQDLKSQLQGQEDRIDAMHSKIEAAEQANEQQADSLKQQLIAEQSIADQLKEELDAKTAESDKMTVMMADYQKKLEVKDMDYNMQLQQMLMSKNYQAQMEKQIDDLNAQLQGKEAEIAGIKKNMSDLQEDADAKSRDIQTKDLSLSMVQQKMMDERISEYQDKINELQVTNDKQLQEITSLKTDLALVRQQLAGMPSSDEVVFLRTGLKNATVQLKQKDELLAQIKVNTNEFENEFKGQTQEFQSLKDQLLSSQQEIQQKNDDLNNKDVEIGHLKDLSQAGESDLKAQVIELTQRIDAAEANLRKAEENKNNSGALQTQLDAANAQIQDLQAELKQKQDMLDQAKASTDTNISNLKAQVSELTQRINAAEQNIQNKPQDNSPALQAQLDTANAQIQDLRAQLKQKEDTLSQVQASSDEYQKEFKKQSQEFQSLKDQLADAQDDIQRKDEDLKYKDMAVTRIKDISKANEADLKAQVQALTARVQADEKELQGKPDVMPAPAPTPTVVVVPNGKVNGQAAMQAELDSANQQVQQLQNQIKEMDAAASGDRLREKLKQALDEVDEQGRVINLLVQKLHDAGQSVDLSKDFAKS